MAGFQISEALYLGYLYEWETTNLYNCNLGSHEVFLRYELFKNKKNVNSKIFLKTKKMKKN